MQDASSKQQTKQKYKPSHQQTGLPPQSTLPIRGKTNTTKIQTQSSGDRINTSLSLAHESKNKQSIKNSAQISPFMKLTQTTGLTLGEQKPEGKNNSTLKPWKRRPQTQ